MSLESRIHLCHCSCGNDRLEVAQVLCTEQELAIEVALLNSVKICDIDGAVGSRAKANHAPVLQHLTADSSGPNQKLSIVENLFLESLAKHGYLAIIPGTCRLAIYLARKSRWEGFKGVEVSKLNDRVEFCGTRFQNLLGNQATNNGINRSKITTGLIRQLGQDSFVDIGIYFLRKGNQYRGVLGITRTGETLLLKVELPESLEPCV